MNDKALVDVIATLARLTDQALPEDAAEDSFDLTDVLLDKPGEFMRSPVIMHSINGTFAIRMDQWKLIAGSGSGGRGQPKSKPFDKPYQLYDLDKDPSETTNLIEENAKIAEVLERYLTITRRIGLSRAPSEHIASKKMAKSATDRFGE